MLHIHPVDDIFFLMKAIFVTNVFGEYGSNKTRSTVIENGFLLFGKTLSGGNDRFMENTNSGETTPHTQC